MVLKAPTHDELAPEAGFTEVFAPVRGGVGRSFVSGEPSGDRLRVRYGYLATDRLLRGRCWFGPGAEGPPSHAHGGSMAALLDEAMGTCAWASGHGVVAARIEVEFRTLLPLGRVVVVESQVSRVEGRKVHVTGRITDGSATRYATSTGLFLELGAERFAGLVGP